MLIAPRTSAPAKTKRLILGIGVAVAFLAIGGTITPPLFAQEAAGNPPVTPDTDCSKTVYANQVGGDLTCEALKNMALRKQSEELDRQLKEADIKLKNEERIHGCIIKIKSALTDGRISKEQLGKVTRENVCRLAESINILK